MNPREWALRKGLTESSTDGDVRELARDYLRFQRRHGAGKATRSLSVSGVEDSLREERHRLRQKAVRRKRAAAARKAAREPKSGDSDRPRRPRTPATVPATPSSKKGKKERTPKQQYQHSRSRYLEHRASARQHSRSSKVIVAMMFVVAALAGVGIYLGSPDSAVTVARDNSPRVWVLSAGGNITSVHKGYLRGTGLEPPNKDDVTMVPVSIPDPQRIRVPVTEWRKGESLVVEAKGGQEVICIVESNRGIVITRNSGKGEVRCESMFPG